MDDIENLFKETISEFTETCSRSWMTSWTTYDYKHKDTGNNRNGHSSKTQRTSFGRVNVVGSLSPEGGNLSLRC